MTKIAKRTVILFSGGLDSTTCLALSHARGDAIWLLSFDYGQKHATELNAAKKIAASYPIESHIILPLTLPNPHTTALVHDPLAIPDYNPEHTQPPNTYVPGRNTLFLSYAMSLAESIQAQRIMIGCSSIDYSGYPDCRPQYIEAFQNLITLAIPEGVNSEAVIIEAPLLHLSKAETIRLGHSLDVNYADTYSCYRGTQPPCGTCDSCVLRKKGFESIHMQA